MPKLVDHDDRRREITDAGRRVIARDGLRSATFQSVAAEAGVSVRLVQYYFGTKRDVLLAIHRAVAADAGGRISRGLAALGAHASAFEIVRALLVELLPVDAARRQDAVVLGAFHAEALTGGEVSPDDTTGAPRFLTDTIAAELRRLGDGDEAADLDARLVVAAAAGLAQQMLVDPEVTDRADLLLDHLLQRFLPGRS